MRPSGLSGSLRSQCWHAARPHPRGYTLVVTRIDRLARSLKDLQDIVHELKAKGVVALKATEQPVDTGSAAGKAFLDMLGVFAEFEARTSAGSAAITRFAIGILNTE